MLGEVLNEEWMPFLLDEQRLCHPLDGDGKARRRPVAGGALHDHNQNGIGLMPRGKRADGRGTGRAIGISQELSAAR